MPSSELHPSRPVLADFPSEHLTISAGVAIFHLATSRVVLCYHTREKYWFLPKGRKDVNETLEQAAQREGFEETGYRNRLLPLPLTTRQTQPAKGHESFVKEAVWTQLMPLSARSQYLLFWFIAETVPPSVECSLSKDTHARHDAPGVAPQPSTYAPPPPFPSNQTLKQRVVEDHVNEVDGPANVYVPVHHSGTGVCEDELCYESHLLPIDGACKRLHGTIMEDVVRRGWNAIQLRMQMEE